MPLPKGQVVNKRYRIVRLLREDSAGAIYRAWDIDLNRPCALQEQLVNTYSANQGFNRYASQLFKLRHPNLPRVTDHFLLPGQGQYLVMDYIEGEDLDYRVARTGGPLPEPQVLTWLTQICNALIYLHSQVPAIVHRDIRPANIQVTPQGRAMLVNFGVPRFYHTTPGGDDPGPPMVIPGYSPPEQYTRGTTDAQSEVYSLGATAFHLITARRPLESVQRTVGAHLPDPRTLNPSLTLRTVRAVTQALSLQPGDRFSSVEEFRDALLTTKPLDVGGMVGSFPQSAPLPPRSAPTETASDDQAGAAQVVQAEIELPRDRNAGERQDDKQYPDNFWERLKSHRMMVATVVSILSCFGCVLILLLLPSITPDPWAFLRKPASASIVEGTVLHHFEGGDYRYLNPGDAVPFGEGSIVLFETGLAEIDLPGNYRLITVGSAVRPSSIEFFQSGVPGETSQTILRLISGSLFLLADRNVDDSILLTVQTPVGFVNISGSIMGNRFNPEAMIFEVDCVEGVCNLEGDTPPLLSLLSGQRGWVDQSGKPNGPFALQLDLYSGYPLADFIPAHLQPGVPAIPTGSPAPPQPEGSPTKAPPLIPQLPGSLPTLDLPPIEIPPPSRP